MKNLYSFNLVSDLSQRYYSPPSATELDIIMSDYDEKTFCSDENEWTNWESAHNANGDDFEKLKDHQIQFE